MAGRAARRRITPAIAVEFCAGIEGPRHAHPTANRIRQGDGRVVIRIGLVGDFTRSILDLVPADRRAEGDTDRSGGKFEQVAGNRSFPAQLLVDGLPGFPVEHIVR